MKGELLKAIELALAGEWDAAHRIVQRYESDPTAAWIHAVLHKIEGDLDNSRYWYHRAGKMESVADEPRGELARIKAEIMLGGASQANCKAGKMESGNVHDTVGPPAAGTRRGKSASD